MAENIPIYAYTGICTGILGEKGYMGVFLGCQDQFSGPGGEAWGRGFIARLTVPDAAEKMHVQTCRHLKGPSRSDLGVHL
jgi:hypothetical protein